MFCEMYTSKSKMRMDPISNVFADAVKTFSLFSLEPIPAFCSGDSLLSAIERLGPPPLAAEACTRVFVETDRTGGGSISLDVYAAGRSPGFSGAGVMEVHVPPAPDEEGTIVMYQVVNDKVAAVWVGEDVGRGMQDAGSREMLVRSPLWAHCLAVIRVNTKGVLTCHFSNYALEAKDTLGLGLGTVNESIHVLTRSSRASWS